MDLQKVCRFCLLPKESMQSIFSEIQLPNPEVTQLRKHSILEILKIFTNISVSRNDGLPENVCYVCLNKVKQSFIFKLKIEKFEARRKGYKNDGKIIDEYERYTKDDSLLIKTEYCDTSNDEELVQTDLSDNSDEEISLVQEVKLEPELDLNIESEYLEQSDKNHGQSSHAGGSTSISIHQRTYQCELCSNKYSRRTHMITHMKKAHNVGSLKTQECPICFKTFDTKCYLNKHMKVHTGEKPHQCEICKKNYRFRSSLLYHVRKIHIENSSKEFKCSSCLRLFESKALLDLHMKIHTAEKPFQCEICHAKFRLKHGWTMHMQTMHSSVAKKKLKCTLCSKIFTRKYLFTEHMIRHTGETPFQCKLCPKKFAVKASLMQHMIRTVHADISRKHKCSLCSKLFERKYINIHMRTHTGEKPFHCKICPKKYPVESGLKTHMKRVHGVEIKLTRNN